MEPAPLAESSSTTHSGWLWKEGARGGFRRRWFALEATAGAPVLRYYDTIDAAGPKGSIPLEPGRFRVRRPKSQRSGQFAACVRLDLDQPPSGVRRKYILASETAGEMDAWKAALRSVGEPPSAAGGGRRRAGAATAGPPRPLLMSDRERCVAMATICGQARRFDEMVTHVVTLAAARTALSEEEERLLTEAFGQVASARRASWRALCAAEHEQEHLGHARFSQRASELRSAAEDEVRAHCHTVLGALEGLIPSASRPASRILYLLLFADNHRYLAEVERGAPRLTHTKEALTHYQAAVTTAGSAILPDHPTALALALGHATLVAELLGEEGRGSAMATKAFDQALAALSGGGGAGEEEASATLEERLGRMQLLKDAARRWQAAAEEHSEGSEDEDD